MPTKQIETSDVMDPDLQSRDPRSAGVVDRGTLVVIMQILSVVSKGSGLAKRIRS